MNSIVEKLKAGHILSWKFQEEALTIRVVESSRLFIVCQQEWMDTVDRQMKEDELLAFLEQRFSSPDKAAEYLLDKK